MLFAARRMTGFLLFAGMSMVILAAIVLLPAYASATRTRYRLACDRARIADTKKLIAARERQIAALPGDPVLTKRLAMRQLGLFPSDEIVVFDLDDGQEESDMIHVPPHPRPSPPSGRLIRTAAKLQSPPMRRGLLLLAGAAIATAMFLFGPPETYRGNEPASHRRKRSLTTHAR